MEVEGNAQGMTTSAKNHQKPSRAGTHKRGKVSDTEYPSAENCGQKLSVHNCEMVFSLYKPKKIREDERGW